jgi:hypothetical protein
MVADIPHAHRLIEQLSPGQLAAVVHLLETMGPGRPRPTFGALSGGPHCRFSEHSPAARGRVKETPGSCRASIRRWFAFAPRITEKGLLGSQERWK